MTKGPKARGVFQRHRRWWIRWVCTLGHDHRNLSGDLKTVATEEHKAKRAAVREARKTGTEYCPRLVQRQDPRSSRTSWPTTWSTAGGTSAPITMTGPKLTCSGGGSGIA
jgi:hypothetical protein